MIKQKISSYIFKSDRNAILLKIQNYYFISLNVCIPTKQSTYAKFNFHFDDAVKFETRIGSKLHSLIQKQTHTRHLNVLSLALLNKTHPALRKYEN